MPLNGDNNTIIIKLGAVNEDFRLSAIQNMEYYYIMLTRTNPWNQSLV